MAEEEGGCYLDFGCVRASQSVWGLLNTDEDPLCSGCWWLNVSEGPREARGRCGSCWSLVTSLCHRLRQFTHICDANNCLLAFCVWGSFAGELSGVHPLQSLWGRRQGDGMTCEEWHTGTLLSICVIQVLKEAKEWAIWRSRGGGSMLEVPQVGNTFGKLREWKKRPYRPWWRVWILSTTEGHWKVLSKGIVWLDLHYENFLLIAAWRIDYRGKEWKWGAQAASMGEDSWWCMPGRAVEGKKQPRAGTCSRCNWHTGNGLCEGPRRTQGNV